MRVLYVGNLTNGENSYSRYVGALNLFDIHGFNIGDYIGSLATGLFSRALRRARRIVFAKQLKQDLSEYILLLKPSHIFFDKPVQFDSQFVRYLKHLSNAKFISYNPDTPFGKFGLKGWHDFVGAIPDYDLHLVPRDIDIQRYKSAGASEVTHIFPSRGICQSVNYIDASNKPIKQPMGLTLGFVGGASRRRYEILEGIATSLNIRPIVAGNSDWSSFDTSHFDYRAGNFRGSIYSKLLSSIDINLGFLREENQDGYTSRSMEIPAAGSLLLAPRTPEHERLFRSGSEAVFYDGPYDLIQKLSDLILDPATVNRIAIAGQRRLVESNYTYEGFWLRLMNNGVFF